jgi:hypothetical protein
MKRTIILLFVVLATRLTNAQGCLPEGIIFYTQEEIDNFQANYPGCTEIEGDVMISENNPGAITNLNGLSVLTSIGGELWIENNEALVSFAGLNSIEFVNDLKIGYNNSLVNLSGLDNLAYVANIAGIVGNESLTSLSGLESLDYVGNSFGCGENPLLTDVSSVNSISYIGNNIYIYSNLSLEHLMSLTEVTSIGGELVISANNSLVDLSGLESLTSIGEQLVIEMNPILNDIGAIQNMDLSTISNLLIYENSSLSECDVLSICNYLANPNDTVIIHDNAPGCNSPEEVQEACQTSVKEWETRDGITIIPNPSNNKITISLPSITGNTQFSIFNVSGEKVLERQLTDNETLFDISAIMRGVYFVRVQDENQVQITKLIKQ